ncbi:DUF5076 domain-containing protein [Brevundimonas sp.]|uniref:DUF5076 domain-containing protein n=1 Tax=Brevundimonas sp. TaxID=1871086 RepID=UPI001DD7F920|nr:DUF5076 domain-containing protein [Brevundimonas sp.]MBL0947628.1 DUF5076 domain-containing protein [Brevundimonas sp.]
MTQEISEFQLTTPESVASDPDAVEFTRMWWSRGEPVMSIKPAFNDPRQYGHMLALAAKHMAHGYAVRHGQDERKAYNAILEGFSDILKRNDVQTLVEKE